MTDLKDESLANLACLLVSAASDLNGTSLVGSRMDGGQWSKKRIQEVFGEITRRFQADPSVAEDPALKPVIEAVRDVQDITNSREIAMAVKHLPHTPYVDVAVVKPANPFARKP